MNSSELKPLIGTRRWLFCVLPSLFVFAFCFWLKREAANMNGYNLIAEDYYWLFGIFGFVCIFLFAMTSHKRLIISNNDMALAKAKAIAFLNQQTAYKAIGNLDGSFLVYNYQGFPKHMISTVKFDNQKIEITGHRFFAVPLSVRLRQEIERS
jgi:hypothetical protein